MEWVVPAMIVVACLIGLWLVPLGVSSVIDHGPIWWARLKSKWHNGHSFSESVAQARDRVQQRRAMRPNNPVIIALILAVAAVVCVWLMTYYDPYRVCIRANTEEGHSLPAAWCTRWGPK